MGNLDSFSTDQYEPMADFTPIPDGEYIAMITESGFKDVNNKPQNKYLYAKIEIVEGKYKGRILYDNFNLINDNIDAVEIAQRKIGSLTLACFGFAKKVSDSSEFHGIPIVVKTGIQPAKDGWKAKNEVKLYKKLDNNKQPEAPKQEEPKPFWQNQ